MIYDAEYMMRRAREAAPMEACGLVFPDGTTVEVLNVSKKEGEFVMDADAFRAAVVKHGMFDAIWHTHPNGSYLPSDADYRIHAETYPDRAMIIATPELTCVHAAAP